MKKSVFIICIFYSLISCKSTKISNEIFFSSVKVDTILIDAISIRPLAVSTTKVWYAADKNRVGFVSLIDANKMQRQIKKDSVKMEFRSIAQTTDAIFVLTISNPALLYKFSKDLNSKQLVYQENNEKVFYDSMHFWNDNEGIAIGDPTENCLSIIITRDGGNTWNKIPCNKLPKIIDGEAAFAASNTNISIVENNTWIVTGGKKARVFYSPDKGTTWSVFNTPIVQGQAMTGIFTSDFYDYKTGFIAGGNYDKPNQNFQNKAFTSNGGKTWKLVGENQGFGYASCVQFVPYSSGKQLVSVGTSGLYYSKDSGSNWQKLLDDTTLYTIKFISKTTAVAAGKNKIIKLEFK